MSTITIPRSIAGAQTKLAELGGLVTAAEWHRAAIVAAFVDPGQRGSNPIPEVGLERASAFAKRGIRGLTSDTTVSIYARAWLDRFPRPKPGSKVELPDDKWPPTTGDDPRHANVQDREAIMAAAQDAGVGPLKAVDIAKNKAAMAAAIKGSPAVAAAAAEALADSHPDIAAEAMVDNADADTAISQARLSRNLGRPGTSEIRDRNKAREKRMDDAIDDSTTEMERTGLAEHEGNSNLRMAAMWLAKAAVEFERNPDLVGEQQDRHDEALRRIDHYVGLLHGKGEWTNDDDNFLRDLGIEGVTS